VKENASEKYAISVKDLVVRYRSMKSFSIRGSALNLGNRKKDVFEALKGVSFDVETGRIVGVVGRNGSGKSTLLRTIAGVFSPDEGELTTYDNRVSLLAIGVGFQTQLSGIENIYLSGLLLGFDLETIKAKIPEIVEFSELGDFVYKPVRTYSSGMHSKLSFSITAILEADVILIDEVLSVGDVNFKKKSEEKMREIIQGDNKTVVIVSHSMKILRELCTEAIWIEGGKMKAHGETNKVIDEYEQFMKEIRKP